MAGVEQLPARLDLEFVAGNPFDLTVTCTGATVTSPVVTMATSGGDSYTTDPGVPAVSVNASVVSVGFAAADSSALNATVRGKTYRWSLAGTCDGEGPFELCAGTVTVRPVGSYGTSSSSSATLAVTVGGAAVSLAVSLGGSGSGGTSIVVQEGDSTVVSTVSTLDFGTGFDVTESPSGEANIALDLTEYSGGIAPLTDHLNDTVDAHDASAISFSPTGSISATTVQAAIAELDTEQAAAALTPTTGSVAIDFSAGILRDIALTGDVTFTTSNLANGRSVTVRVSAAATRSLTFPAWVFVGTTPSQIASGKTGVLTVISFGTTNADCVAAWGVQP